MVISLPLRLEKVKNVTKRHTMNMSERNGYTIDDVMNAIDRCARTELQAYRHGATPSDNELEALTSIVSTMVNTYSQVVDTAKLSDTQEGALNRWAA